MTNFFCRLFFLPTIVFTTINFYRRIFLPTFFLQMRTFIIFKVKNTLKAIKCIIILKWYFTKYDDLILFHFNMKKLNMLNFLHIKMMKTSFEIIAHHCFVLATTGNSHTCVYFYVNIRLNKSLVQQNLKIVSDY